MRPALAGPTDASGLFDRFAAELTAVGGRAVLVGDTRALARAVAEIVAAAGGTVAVHNAELALTAASGIRQDDQFDSDDASIEKIERAGFSLIQAESLVGETGSAVVLVTTRGARLLPYLPPACIIVARLPALREHLDARALTGDPSSRGERVIITGPSRTADIEKTIVLGAHGPASLTVFVVAS